MSEPVGQRVGPGEQKKPEREAGESRDRSSRARCRGGRRPPPKDDHSPTPFFFLVFLSLSHHVPVVLPVVELDQEAGLPLPAAALLGPLPGGAARPGAAQPRPLRGRRTPYPPPPRRLGEASPPRRSERRRGKEAWLGFLGQAEIPPVQLPWPLLWRPAVWRRGGSSLPSSPSFYRVSLGGITSPIIPSLRAA